MVLISPPKKISHKPVSAPTKVAPPQAQAAAAPTTQISLIGDDMYAVLSDTHTLGFVYKVGNVFVALSGRDFGRAVEVGQTLSWDRAVELVREH
jgi:hypothetical protein